MISWLEDPTVFEYVRQSILYRRSRRGSKRGAKLPIKSFYRLLGYEPVRQGAFRIFWLKTYDASCPEELDAYSTGRRPSEARFTSELITDGRQD